MIKLHGLFNKMLGDENKEVKDIKDKLKKDVKKNILHIPSPYIPDDKKR